MEKKVVARVDRETRLPAESSDPTIITSFISFFIYILACHVRSS